MFQRIQTVYLFLVCVCMAVSIFSPLAIMECNGSTVELNAFSFYKGVDIAFETIVLFVIGLISSLISLIAIFLFKNRKKQIRITIWNIIIMIVFIVYLLYLSFMKGDVVGIFTKFSWGALLPLIAIIFAIISIKRIKKDEELVRSLERLR
ncbi:MAG: DUF4293 domain-containing protein [Dysgonamonadaceae bacterium]|nr:DUF4293 domain-containing protein [Dysgonamonadaceae bacterium]